MAGCSFGGSTRTRNRKSWLFLAFTFLPLFGPQVPVNGAGTVQFDNGRAIDADVYRANQVTAADLDGDGDQDILVCSYWGDFVKWYENEDGKGTFSDAADISTNSNGAGRLDVGDLDGDGFPDVVVASNLDNQITWFRNLDGDVFSVGGEIDTANPVDVQLVDLDGDGDLDLIYTSVLNDRVAWFKNTDGEGTFEVGRDISTTSNGATRVAVADLAGDGSVDVVLASYADHLEWFKNSNGVLSLGVELQQQTPATGAKDIVAADFDGDGYVDVVSYSFDGVEDSPRFPDGRLILFMNNGAGSFEEGKDIGLLDSARTVVAVDLDNDEDIDLVASDYIGGRIVWYENDGHGDFSAAIDIALDVGVSSVIAADLDGDGDLDLVASNRETARVVWYENLLVEATPAPLPTTTPSPDPSASETPTPTPFPVTPPTNPTQPPASSASETPTPTPFPVTPPTNPTQPPASSASETPTPTPFPVTPPTNPTQPPASPIDGTTPTPTPITAPTGAEPTAATPTPIAAPTGAEPTTDPGTSGNGSYTDEILIGVATTLASGLVVGVVKKFQPCSRTRDS